jgi:hypothetical protein
MLIISFIRISSRDHDYPLHTICATGKSRAGNPVVYVIGRRLLANINADLLLFILVDSLYPFMTANNAFELIIDSTGM